LAGPGALFPGSASSDARLILKLSGHHARFLPPQKISGFIKDNPSNPPPTDIGG